MDVVLLPISSANREQAYYKLWLAGRWAKDPARTVQCTYEAYLLEQEQKSLSGLELNADPNG